MNLPNFFDLNPLEDWSKLNSTEALFLMLRRFLSSDMLTEGILIALRD